MKFSVGFSQDFFRINASCKSRERGGNRSFLQMPITSKFGRGGFLVKKSKYDLGAVRCTKDQNCGHFTFQLLLDHEIWHVHILEKLSQMDLTTALSYHDTF